jgi:hypothetical protein
MPPPPDIQEFKFSIDAGLGELFRLAGIIVEAVARDRETASPKRRAVMDEIETLLLMHVLAHLRRLPLPPAPELPAGMVSGESPGRGLDTPSETPAGNPSPGA